MRRLAPLLLLFVLLLGACGEDEGSRDFADTTDEDASTVSVPDDDEEEDDDEGRDPGDDEEADNPEGIPGVEAYDIEDNSHTEGAVDYPQSPPVAGPHNEVWANCNFYDEEIPNENVVHALEHGAVWITFTDDVDDDQLEEISDLVDGSDHVIASRYEDQDSPIVLTAWNRQAEVDDIDDDLVDEFLDTYLLADTSPEPGAPCDGGAGG
jgi:hypothetical protein